MLLTYIPHFREVVIMSFRCDHCRKSFTRHFSLISTHLFTLDHSNNDIQAAGEIQERGSIYTVKITNRADLDRQLVKSENCLITIPEYALQIPASRGQLTTVEGIVADTIRDLEMDQPARLAEHPELHGKIQALVDKLRLIVDDGKADGGEETKMPVFTIKLDDPSGNSFVETHGGLSDPKWSKREYIRDNAQNASLGLRSEDKPRNDDDDIDLPEEVLSFPTTCSLCGSNLETLMKTVNIPHFKVCPVLMWCSLFAPPADSHFHCRTSSSCRPTAMTVATVIPKSSLEVPHRHSAAKLRSKSRTQTT